MRSVPTLSTRLLRSLVLLASTTFALTSSAYAKSTLMLIEPPYTHVSLSPNGQFIAAYEKKGFNQNDILIFDTQTQKSDSFHISDGKGMSSVIKEILWINDEHLAILSYGEGGNDWLHVFKRGDKQPTRIAKEGFRTLIKAPNVTDAFYVVERIKRDERRGSRLLKYDPREPATEPSVLYESDSWNLEVILDANGELRIAKTTDPDDTEIKGFAQDQAHPIALTAIPNTTEIHGIDQASGHAIVGTQVGDSLPALYVFDIEKDKFLGAIAKDESYSMAQYGDPVFDPNSGKLVGLHVNTTVRRTLWSDTNLKEAQAKVDQLLSGTNNRIDDWSADRKKVLVKRLVPSYPSSYVHVNLSSEEIIPVYLNGPNVKLEETGQTRMLEVSNRDGTKLSLVLTLPPGASPQKLPLVVWLSRGTWYGLERPEWNGKANFFAAEGFAVARINYRGRNGLLGPLAADRSTIDGIRLAFNDIEDSVKALIEAGVVDPDLVCIAGEADGAWAAAYAPIASPGLYKAVVCINGLYDLNEYRHNEDKFRDIGSTSLQIVGGDKFSPGVGLSFAQSYSSITDEELTSLSPFHQTQDYPKQVFVSIGKWSNDTYKNQTKTFVKNLKDNEVKVKSYSGNWPQSLLSSSEEAKTFEFAADLLHSATKWIREFNRTRLLRQLMKSLPQKYNHSVQGLESIQSDTRLPDHRS